VPAIARNEQGAVLRGKEGCSEHSPVSGGLPSPFVTNLPRGTVGDELGDYPTVASEVARLAGSDAGCEALARANAAAFVGHVAPLPILHKP
jgi:hypothetical protein